MNASARLRIVWCLYCKLEISRSHLDGYQALQVIVYPQVCTECQEQIAVEIKALKKLNRFTPGGSNENEKENG